MPSDSPVSKIGTTFGWSIEAASCASDLKRFRKSRLSASSAAITLSATARSRPSWVAR